MKSIHIWLLISSCSGFIGELAPVAIAEPLDFPSPSLSTQTVPESMETIIPVSELSDVKPTDWAFQALQQLIENYNCLQGYPDGTFRGNQELTRYEFAAALNSCLERLIPQLEETTVDLETLETIQGLQQRFRTELDLLAERVDSLEGQIAQLEDNQFSPLVKLGGSVIIGVQDRNDNTIDIDPRDGVAETQDPGTEIHTTYLAQISLNTLLTPRSSLFLGLWQTDFTRRRSGFDGFLSYQIPISGFEISDLTYRHLVADNLAMMIGTEGVDMLRAFRGPSRVEGAATGSVSTFAQRNPLLNIGVNGGGVALDWQFARWGSFQAVYAEDELADGDDGLFTGNRTAAAQVLLTPVDQLDISVYYVNNYSPTGFVLFAAGDNQLTAVDPVSDDSEDLQTHGVGATLNWQITPQITAGAWGGYTYSYIPGESGHVETVNYMAYLNFPDLGGEGNLGGIYIGQPPKIVSSTLPIGNNVPDFLDTEIGAAGGQPSSTLHLEAFYRIRLNDNIGITPGIIHIINPGHTSSSDPITIGVLRTSFTF